MKSLLLCTEANLKYLPRKLSDKVRCGMNVVCLFVVKTPSESELPKSFLPKWQLMCQWSVWYCFQSWWHSFCLLMRDANMRQPGNIFAEWRTEVLRKKLHFLGEDKLCKCKRKKNNKISSITLFFSLLSWLRPSFLFQVPTCYIHRHITCWLPDCFLAPELPSHCLLANISLLVLL